MNKIWILVALSIGGVSANVHATNWTMNPTGSELGFTAAIENAQASGVFRTFNASGQFDPDRPADSRLDVTVTVSSADMISDDVNKAIRGPDWFDAERFPVAEFHSTEVRAAGANGYVAVGTLKVKDVAKPVEVPFSWKREGDTATINGELTINRAVFKIGLGEWLSTKVVGADVKVKFSVRLRRSG
jgi:polyisoprenoid-binding protein YceI